MGKLRNLYLFDEVSYTGIKGLFQELDSIEQDSEITRVRLTICSYGGYIYPALAFYDRLKKFTKPVEALATGACQSSALTILQAAHKRLATENTIFLIHQAVGNVDETNVKHIVVEAHQQQKNDERMAYLTYSRSHLSREKFEELTAEPCYFTPQQALEYGFIDEIV